MANAAPLSLSQQILSWLLQAAGLLAEDRDKQHRRARVSRSTVKTALRGEPILRSWSDLVDSVLDAMGLPTDPNIRDQIKVALRDFDEQVGQLDAFGLPWEDRLPVVLRVIAPHLGVRFGALAALAEKNIQDDVRLADWLCDPLDRRAFGRALEVLLTWYRPDLKTWDKRADHLSKTEGIHRRTIERWRVGKTAVPNAEMLARLAARTANGNDARSAFALRVLRVARVLKTARAGVAAWTNDCVADDFQALVKFWTTHTRQQLTSREGLSLLATTCAEIMRKPIAPQFMNRIAWAGGSWVGASPEDAAERFAACAENPHSDDARCLVLLQVFDPSPLLFMTEFTVAGLAAGDVRYDQPWLAIQSAWQNQFVLRALSQSPSLVWRGAAFEKTVPLDDDLRQRASRLAEAGRSLFRQPGRDAADQMDALRLSCQLAFATGGLDAMHEFVRQYNEQRRFPSWLARTTEPLADEDTIRQVPAAAVTRARRLALQGDHVTALRHLNLWFAAKNVKLREERIAAAEALTHIGHSRLDEIEESNEPGRLCGLVDRLLERADQVFSGETSLEADRLIHAFPLALRLDLYEAELRAEKRSHLRRATALAARFSDLTTSRHSHGPLWAMLAVWQTFTGGDATLALKRAEHFGSRDVYEREMERLRADGWLTQDAGGSTDDGE